MKNSKMKIALLIICLIGLILSVNSLILYNINILYVTILIQVIGLLLYCSCLWYEWKKVKNNLIRGIKVIFILSCIGEIRCSVKGE